MKILVLNCGSASVKYQLIETSPEQMKGNRDVMLKRGSVEKFDCYETAVRAAIADLVPDPAEIEAVGHRIVHGGERFSGAVVIDETVEREIERFNEIAPLHNPANLAGYRASRAVLPHCPHVAVFDTGFHQSIPRHHFLYAIPYDYYERLGVRRYGFHGSSHRYITLRYAEIQGADPAHFNLIICHLGNGCSVCAVEKGRSIETSMGFTPLEGLVMGTRGGDLDPGALLFLMEKEGLDVQAASRMLNRECGLLGLSGESNDMRRLGQLAEQGDQRARLAVDVFCHRVRKYIGSSYALLNGADALVFTGGIGENQPEIRARICQDLDALGVKIDPERNAAAWRTEADIAADGAATRIWVIPTNEELLIARDTFSALAAAWKTAAP